MTGAARAVGHVSDPSATHLARHVRCRAHPPARGKAATAGPQGTRAPRPRSCPPPCRQLAARPERPNPRRCPVHAAPLPRLAGAQGDGRRGRFAANACAMHAPTLAHPRFCSARTAPPVRSAPTARHRAARAAPVLTRKRPGPTDDRRRATRLRPDAPARQSAATSLVPPRFASYHRSRRRGRAVEGAPLLRE